MNLVSFPGSCSHLEKHLVTAVFAVLLACTTSVFAADVTVGTDETWDSGSVPADIDTLTISTGATLTISGAVTITAAEVTVETGAAISSDGTG